jgi:hypothetical protein
LIEIDSRRLYLGEGYASMFAYCTHARTRALHMAEGAAYNRIEAARAARTYPVILTLFEQSAITLTAVRLVAPHLTGENHAAVLTSAKHKSKHAIEELVASLGPKPDAPVVIRRLTPPGATGGSMLAVCDSPAEPTDAVTRRESETPSGMVSPLSTARACSTPLSPERYRIQLTVSRETHDKFRRAQALLRHALPGGEAGEIFDRAITLLIERLERDRFAATAAPRQGTGQCAARRRHIPAAVRRAVWQRDGGRCAFVGPAGCCGETAFLEFHHLLPYAAGGAATTENIELRCRAHNGYEARLFFGSGEIREERATWADSFRNELLRELLAEAADVKPRAAPTAPSSIPAA